MPADTISLPITIEKGLELSSLFGHEDVFVHVTYQEEEIKFKVTGWCIHPDRVDISAVEVPIPPRLILNAFSPTELTDQLLEGDCRNELLFEIREDGLWLVEVGWIKGPNAAV